MRCRSCNKSIVFLKTTSGRAAPFELDPAGEFEIRDGRAVHVGPPPQQLELGAAAEPRPDRYTSHFASCPQAKEWRSPR